MNPNAEPSPADMSMTRLKDTPPIELVAWLIGFLALWIFATYAHLYFTEVEAVIALRGWSALDFSNSILHPENYEHDYPGGARSIGRSILVWAYPALEKWGIEAETTLAGMVALEGLLVCSGAIFLLRTFFPRVHPVAMFALSALLTLSWIRHSDLGRIANPFFHGQFYGFADGLRLFAIALFFRGRYQASALTLALGFTIHPLKTLFGMIFIFGAQLWKGRRFFELNIIIPFILLTLFAVLWMWFWLDMGNMANQVSRDEFFRFSPLFNSHWFPQDLGIFGQDHERYGTAFFSAFLAGLAALIRSELNTETKGKIVFGMFVLLLISALGIVSAWYELSPLLVKSCLQRSTVLVLSVATLLVVAQSVRDTMNGQWWFAAIGLLLLGSAFLDDSTWPVLIGLSYTISALVSRATWQQQRWLTIITTLGVIALACYQYALFLKGYQHLSYWAWQVLVLLAAAPLCRLMDKVRLVRSGNGLSAHASSMFTVLIVVAASVGSWRWANTNRTLSDAFKIKGENYQAVQLWAHNNTPKTALFMVDPCTTYGWRDYSNRSSFGSLQEWYKTGWLYSGDRQALHQGIRRGGRLGINIDVLLPAHKRYKPIQVYNAFCTIARTSFYNQDGKILAGIAQDYHIQYVVMDKTWSKRYGGMPDWAVAFENRYYRVLVPPFESEVSHGES